MTRRSHTTLWTHPLRLCSVQRAVCKLGPQSCPNYLRALPFSSLHPAHHGPPEIPFFLLCSSFKPCLQGSIYRLSPLDLPSHLTASWQKIQVTAPSSAILKGPAHVAPLIRLHCNHLYWPLARFRNTQRQEPPRKQRVYFIKAIHVCGLKCQH